MAKFKKKPVIIEAMRWTGGPNQVEDPEWITNAIKSGTVRIEYPTLIIKTLEGDMTASPGDMIIQGVKGELYPCKPDIFKDTYEPVARANQTLLKRLMNWLSSVTDQWSA